MTKHEKKNHDEEYKDVAKAQEEEKTQNAAEKRASKKRGRAENAGEIGGVGDIYVSPWVPIDGQPHRQ